jgi:hypothetical protein
MGRVRERHPTKKVVRIASLDTGCDTGAACIVNLANGEARLKGHWRDWTDNSTDPIDEDPQQHGTSVAAILLRIAGNGEVFVGRVTKNQRDLNGATANIVNVRSDRSTQARMLNSQ